MPSEERIMGRLARREEMNLLVEEHAEIHLWAIFRDCKIAIGEPVPIDEEEIIGVAIRRAYELGKEVGGQINCEPMYEAIRRWNELRNPQMVFVTDDRNLAVFPGKVGEGA